MQCEWYYVSWNIYGVFSTTTILLNKSKKKMHLPLHIGELFCPDSINLINWITLKKNHESQWIPYWVFAKNRHIKIHRNTHGNIFTGSFRVRRSAFIDVISNIEAYSMNLITLAYIKISTSIPSTNWFMCTGAIPWAQ